MVPAFLLTLTGIGTFNGLVAEDEAMAVISEMIGFAFAEPASESVL